MFYQLSRKAFRIKNIDFLIADLFVFALTPFLTLWIRLDSWHLAIDFERGLLVAMSIFIGVKILCASCFDCYRRYWRFATAEDLLQIAATCAAVCFIESLILAVFHIRLQAQIYLLPRSFPILDSLLTFIGIGAVRFSVKLFEQTNHQRRTNPNACERVVIYGAGRAGIALVDAIQQRENSIYLPVAFIDDDPAKRDLKIRGLAVMGGRQQLLDTVDQLKAVRVIIAMPSAGGQAIREIVQLCSDRSIPTCTLPGIHEVIKGRVTLKSLRDIKIEDLLRRETIRADLGLTGSAVRGKRVLVTGAGGSIGSEICRQVLQCAPAEIVLMGHGENSVFEIHQELIQILKEIRSTDPPQSTQLTTLIADLKDKTRLSYAFERFKPSVVFHAAAHKHVPLMEDNPPEAITNNVIGTQNLVDTALSYEVDQFVMISTDKAVNPSSVMGASKRLGELIVLRAAQRFRKQFCVVRFGNVLGSRGSVVPIFKQQIERGGPVTITHPDVTRYFMTIPEAVHLVLQAMTLSQGGEIFMLNMGYPIKIVDLAQDLIRLSGYQVGSEIRITYTGLRPGEKLHEELLLPEEVYEPTVNENLLTIKNAYSQIPYSLDQGLPQLFAAAFDNDEAMIRVLLKHLIPSFKTDSLGTDANAESEEVLYRLNQNASQLEISGKLSPKNSLPSFPRFDIEEELSAAEVSTDFKVLYQPVLLLQQDYLVEGFEALLHWKHRRFGLMRSSQFIEAANQIQCIHNIGIWGIREVCLQIYQLERLNLHPRFTLSVNLSCAQLLRPDLITQLLQIFQETQVNVTRLCFEIPETFISQQEETAIAILGEIKKLGVRLLLDNFGFSPIPLLVPLTESAHLFNGIKIDRSRIHGLTRDTDSANFFKSAMDLSQQWGLDMIATGIESTRQLTHLETLQCKYGQGYYFLQPIEGEQVHVLLQGRSLS